MTEPLPTLVAINWLLKVVDPVKVSRRLPSQDTDAKCANGWLVVPSAQVSPSLGKHEISFVAECYFGSAGFDGAEALAERIRTYVQNLRSRHDTVQVPGRGAVSITSVEYGGATSAVLGDLGNLARADVNLAFRWRSIRAAAPMPVTTGH